MVKMNRFLVFIVITMAITTYHTSKGGMTMVYWDSKPFLYKKNEHNNNNNTASINNVGKTSGILADIFSYGVVFCGGYQSYKTFVTYQQIANTNERFLDILRSTRSSKEILRPHGFDANNTIWAPVVVQISSIADALKRRGLRSQTFHTSEKVVLIIHRKCVALEYKVGLGLWRCRVVLMTSVLMSLCFGLLLWIVERKYNPGNIFLEFIRFQNRNLNLRLNTSGGN